MDPASQIVLFQCVPAGVATTECGCMPDMKKSEVEYLSSG